MINILTNKLDDFIGQIKKIQSSYNFSEDIPNLNKKTLRYFDCDEMYEKVLDFYNLSFLLFDDFIKYLNLNKDNRSKVMFRLKSEDSFIKKWNKNILPGKEKKFYKACNDNFGFRFVIDCEREELVNLINSIDFKNLDVDVINFYSNIKTDDDGYRGIHLYFWYNRRNYPIEFQIWTIKDLILQSYTHEIVYKGGNDDEKREYSLKLRKWLDCAPKCPDGVEIDYIKYLYRVYNKER